MWHGSKMVPRPLRCLIEAGRMDLQMPTKSKTGMQSKRVDVLFELTKTQRRLSFLIDRQRNISLLSLKIRHNEEIWLHQLHNEIKIRASPGSRFPPATNFSWFQTTQTASLGHANDFIEL